MFSTDNVPVVLRKLTLKLESDDDDETMRICETTFRVGRLSIDLAQAIVGVPVVASCWKEESARDGEISWRPRWDINDVKFTPPAAHFLVALKSAPDTPESLADLVDAEIITVRVWRPTADKRDLALEFHTRHALERGDAKDLAALLTAWEHGSLYITLTEIRAPLMEQIDDRRTH